MTLSFVLVLSDSSKNNMIVYTVNNHANRSSNINIIYYIIIYHHANGRSSFFGMTIWSKLKPIGFRQDAGQSSGSVSIDTAIAVAQTLKNLRLEEPNVWAMVMCKSKIKSECLIHNFMQYLNIFQCFFSFKNLVCCCRFTMAMFKSQMDGFFWARTLLRPIPTTRR